MSKTVLIIDDDAAIRASLGRLLRMEGYDTAEAADGREGLDAARDAKPCVILLDLMMPRMNGWEFRDEQRLDASVRHIPVVVISAHGTARQLESSVTAEAYFEKPLDFDRLLQTIEQLC